MQEGGVRMGENGRDRAELVLDVAQVTELERRIAEAGTPLSELMERAGTAVADTVCDLARDQVEWHATAQAFHEAGLHENEPKPPLALVLCGSGNNGGDGWVAARVLAQRGWRVAVMTARLPEEIKAQPAHDAAVEAARVLEASKDASIIVNPDALVFLVYREADVIIDALLGTGFSGDAVRAPYSWWIQVANEFRSGGARVVAADVPSGLSAQTGTAADPCIEADLTVTMIVQKAGLTLPQAARYCGDVRVAPLAPVENLLDGLA